MPVKSLLLSYMEHCMKSDAFELQHLNIPKPCLHPETVFIYTVSDVFYSSGYGAIPLLQNMTCHH
ncbi:hypothetical protein DPMN_185013 [Dreissena polymorpha]|uniref:Uncharacterized protein n=1 Tax=Dreissena polymorpha TaxID=45954 RepID=A0A9D4I6Y4_DREPO|nr:hypothetical protein DPMN_185013 [Dreissena polymorpha]